MVENFDIVKLVINYGIRDINEVVVVSESPKIRSNPILEAIATNNIEIIELLVKNGANINIELSGQNALSIAIKLNSLPLVKKCIEHGLEIKKLLTSLNIVYSLVETYFTKNKEIFNFIVNLDEENRLIIKKTLAPYKFTLNQLEIVEFLVKEYDFDINKINTLEGDPLLIEAIRNPNFSTRFYFLKRLIELGANPYLKDYSGANAFDYAQNDIRVIRILKKSSFSPEKEKLIKPIIRSRQSIKKLSAVYASLYPQKKSLSGMNELLPKETGELTISEFYLDIFRDEIWKQYGEGIEKNKINILKLLARERRYYDKYYVFYHANNADHKIAQDFWKEVLVALKLEKLPKDFIFLRFWGEAQKSSRPKLFLQSHGFNIRDIRTGIQKDLLSVNISLVGTAFTSLQYLLVGNYTKNIYSKGLLADIFSFYDFNPIFLDTLASISLRQQVGDMLQIFIPKPLVDKCVYLAQDFGVPFSEKLKLDGFDEENNYQEQISPLLEKIQSIGQVNITDELGQKHLGTEYIVNPTTENEREFQDRQKARVKVLLFAEQFGKTEEKTKTILEELQARIVIGKDIMLNPKSGVKIFREVNLPEAKLKWYRQQISQIAGQVFDEWLGRLLANQISPVVLERIKDTPLGMLVKFLKAPGGRVKLEMLRKQKVPVAVPELSNAPRSRM